MSLLERLESTARRDPERVAIADEHERLGYGELLRAVMRLRERLREGEIVASVLPSGPRFTALQLAALARGAPFLPLPSGAKPAELRALFSRVPGPLVASVDPLDPELLPEGASCLDLSDLFAPTRIEPPRGPRPAAPASWGAAALVQPTSGSTGTPKLIFLDGGALEAGLEASADLASAHAGAAVFVPVPQYHAMGGAAVLEHLGAGATVLVCGRSLPGTDVRRMQAAEVRLIVASPSYARLALRLRLFGKLPALRAVELGSAAAEPELVAALGAGEPALEVHLRYGSSEAFGALARLDVAPGSEPPPGGCVGRPRPGVELAPLPASSEGRAPEEIRVRSPALGRLVLGDDGLRPLADEAGFFATGDAGFLDEGRLVVRGRKSTFIKRNGHRVEPAEIEAVLASHDQAREAIVLATPDPVAGAKIVAFVEGEAAPSALGDRCRARLADHKVPQRIEVVAALPRLPSGKPDRRALLETLSERNPA